MEFMTSSSISSQGMGLAPAAHFNFLTAQVQTEFCPDYARSRIDSFFHEQFAWLEDGLADEELQTCLKGAARQKGKGRHM